MTKCRCHFTVVKAAAATAALAKQSALAAAAATLRGEGGKGVYSVKGPLLARVVLFH